MPCHTRMKRIMQGLLWLLLLEFGLTVMSLEPGFLDFDNLPDTNFSCVGKVIGGYYADLETNCQMFHVCTIGQLDEPMDIRFLCLNGTVFDQETRVCERIDEVDCSKSEQFYSLNLELYGNTQPPILEESPEIDFPAEVKRSSTSTTTTTTTTQRPSRPKSTSPPYYTTSSPPTTTRGITKVITSHHFPVVSAPDIRFNPEEINISLNPGAPPDITRSQVPISFQQQSYSEKNTRVTVTTHTTIYKNDKPHRVPLLPTPNPPSEILVEDENLERPKVHQTTQTPKSVVNYGLTHNQGAQVATPTEVNYGFTYQQTEESVEYHTEVPPHPYQYQLNIANLRPPSAQSHPYHAAFHASKRPHKVNYLTPTTYRNHPAYTSSAKVPIEEHFDSQRTEKPPRLQLPLPLLPTLPPLIFSSPAPFSLGRHIEAKRYTSDHQSPPRIIISASASVSDNSGRRLNYSLGTIGASHFLGSSPASYDDYKEDDVGLDPFYHDVPKIKSTRHKRSVMSETTIKNDQEAADLLKFLFNWYKKRENAKNISIPVTAEDITEINEELAPLANIEASTSADDDYESLFRKMIMENITAWSNNEKALDIHEETGKIQTNRIARLVEPEVTEDPKSKEENKNNNEVANSDKEDAVQLPTTTSLNNVELNNQTEEPIPTTTVRISNKKKKRPRTHRRRNKSSTTTRRTKKPKTNRQNSPVNSLHSPSNFGNLTTNSTSVKNRTRNYPRNNTKYSPASRKTDNIFDNLEYPRHPVQHHHDVSNRTNYLKKERQRKLQEKLQNEENKPTTTGPFIVTSVLIEQTSLEDKTELHTEEPESTTIPMEHEHKPITPRFKFHAKFKSSDTTGLARPFLKPHHSDYESELELKDNQSVAEDHVETHESKQREHVISVNGNTETPITTQHYGSEDYDMDYHSTETKYETTTEIDRYEPSTTVSEESELVSTVPSEQEILNDESISDKQDEHEKVTDRSLSDQSTSQSELTTTFSQDNGNVSNEYVTNLISKSEGGETETESTKNEESSSEFNPDVLEQTTYYTRKDELKVSENDTEALHIDLLNSEKDSTTEPNEESSKTYENEEFTENSTELPSTTEYLKVYSTTSQTDIQNPEELESYTNKVLTDEEDSDKDLADNYTTSEKIEKTSTEENLESKNRNVNKLKYASRRVIETTSAEEEFVVSPKTSGRLRFRRPEDLKRPSYNYIRNRKFIASSQRGPKNTEEPTLIKPYNKIDYENPLHKKESGISEGSMKESESPGIPDYVDDNYEPLTYQDPSYAKEYDQVGETTTNGDYLDLEERTDVDELQHLEDEENLTDSNKVEHHDEHTTEVLDDYEDHSLPPDDKINEDIENKEIEGETTEINVNDDYHIAKTEEDEFTTTEHTKTIPTTPSEQTDSLLPTTDVDHPTTESYLKGHDDASTEFSSTLLTTQTYEITTIPTPVTKTEDYSYKTTTEPATTLDNMDISTVTPTSEYQPLTSTENFLSTLSSHTTDYASEETTINTEATQVTSVTPSSSTDSATKMTSLAEPDYQLDFTTPIDDITTNKYQHLRTRLPWYKRQDNSKRKEHSRHRFNTVNRRKGLSAKPKLDNRILHVLNNSFNNKKNSSSKNNTEELLVSSNNITESNDTETRNDINNQTDVKLEKEVKLEQLHTTTPAVANKINNELSVKQDKTEKLEQPHHVTPVIDLTVTTLVPNEENKPTTPTIEESVHSGENRADIAITDAPLLKSANPTKAKYTKIVFTTTPLSKLVRVELRKDMHGRRYSFNCFNKKIDQFYSDPRDCRLFHYCTSGYTKNQMVDMKFVCDLGTYFDDVKLICTEEKPARCL